MDNIKWLSDWYKSNCDGDWEHTYGVLIETLDNPGWKIKIELTDSRYEGIEFSTELNNGEDDWYQVKCDGLSYEGYGDPDKLDVLINLFRQQINNYKID
jgi:hypothetical protein